MVEPFEPGMFAAGAEEPLTFTDRAELDWWRKEFRCRFGPESAEWLEVGHRLLGHRLRIVAIEVPGVEDVWRKCTLGNQMCIGHDGRCPPIGDWGLGPEDDE